MQLRGYFWETDGWVEKTQEVPDPSDALAVRLAEAQWYLPGLVDSHAHFGIGPEGPLDRAKIQANMLSQVRAGVNVIRELGSPKPTQWLDRTVPAAWVVRAPTHIARPKRYLRNLGIDLEVPQDLPHLVAEQAKPGGWIKLVGDWIDRADGADADLQPLWGRTELSEAIACAHEKGARVTAHVFGERALDDLLAAGIDCIEHGSGMRQDHIDEAVRAGIAVTPTLLQVELFCDFAKQAGKKYPKYAATMNRMYRSRREHFAALVEAGVQLLPGTDAGGYQEHGKIGAELALWQDWAMPASEILTAAIYPARTYLGAPERDFGRDLVAFAADPSRDIRALSEPLAVLNHGTWVS